MTVYFVVEHARHYVEPLSVKIGYSRDLTRRIGELQIGNPIELTLMGEINTRDKAEDLEIEAALHREFRSSWIRGEWFTMFPQDVIDGLKAHSTSAFITVGSDPFEIISYDRDAIPEYASPWEWGDVTAYEFCPVCGWAGGWTYNENFGGERCLKCGASEHHYETCEEGYE